MQVEFRALELLASRLCHELISPVGAINNGVELLIDGDADFAREATALIAQSAKRAVARLQFYRFAYGAGGVGGGAPEAKALVAALLDGSRVRCDWPQEFNALKPEWQKLGCNLLLLAAEALPRGGTVALAREEQGIAAMATGQTLNFAPEQRAVLAPNADIGTLTARTAHAYFTARFAERLGLRLRVAEADRRATFAAV